MSAYLVTYDLNQRGQNYDCLHKKLGAYPTHWHMQGSVWIIESDETAVQIADKLTSCLDGNDNLFVTELIGQSAWIGFSDDGDEWLQEVL